VSLVPSSTLRALVPPLSLPNLPLTRVLPHEEVEAHLLANSGARPLDRDSVDARIILEIRNRSGRAINVPADVGGFPVLPSNIRRLVLPTNPDGVVDRFGRTRLDEWLEGLARKLEVPSVRSS
jgi:hypothetical protein